MCSLNSESYAYLTQCIHLHLLLTEKPLFLKKCNDSMPKDLVDAYDRLAVNYDANRGLFDMSEVFNDFFILLSRDKAHLLDLGCGAGEPIPGWFIQKGWQVTGVDFSKKMLELAARYQPQMHRVLADITEFQMPPASVDAITAVYALFHTEKEKHPGLFAGIYRWLKPGGKALFTYATKEYTGAEEFSGYIRFMSENLFYSHCSPDQLFATLKDIGFELLAADYRDIGGEVFLWVTVEKPIGEKPARAGRREQSH